MNKELKKLTGPLSDWGDKIKQAESGYKFQERLTAKLDSQKEPFTETTILEIVLWKTNRYPDVPESSLDAINDLRKNYTESGAK